MNSLLDIINKAKNSYYNSGDFYELTDEDIDVLNDFGIVADTRTVSDKLYDTLETTYRQLYEADIPVGASVSDNKIPLPRPLPSLNECKEGETDKWIKSMGCKYSDITYMYKLDGCSFYVEYENYKLKSAYTRGDGKKGQFKLELAKAIKHIPNELNHNAGYLNTVGGNIAFRGELILLKRFDKTKIEQNTGKKYSNLRNLVSGQINAKEPDQEFLDNVHFVVYDIFDNFSNDKENKLRGAVASGVEIVQFGNLGAFQSNMSFQRQKLKGDDLFKTIFKLARQQSDYEYDGIVLCTQMVSKYNHPTSATNPNPQNARKFKLKGDEETVLTRVLCIEWNISKNGLIKPTLVISPVLVGGVVISRVTGFNYQFVKDNQLGYGATVKIKRAGDVIPHIAEVVSPAKEVDLPRWDYKIKGVEAVYTGDDSSLQQIKRLTYFCAVFGIKQAGEASMQKLFQNLNITDIFGIKHNRNDVIRYLGMNGKKLCDSVDETFWETTVDPCKYLAGLGVFGANIGIQVLKTIFEQYSLDSWEMLNCNSLTNLNGISDITAKKILDNMPTALKAIEHAQSQGIVFKNRNIKEKGEVVFTGFRDAWLKSRFERDGYIVKDNITSKCTVVVAKDINANSSKLKTARNKNITILPYTTAMQMWSFK